ncbi:MAG: hypothetical protein HOV80_13120 [Polyangiaceae bacterium]|nr:hypothetical protein [Polyangiaceae bacterium]
MKTIKLSVFLLLGALAACGDDASGTDGDGGSGSGDDDDGSDTTSSKASGAGGDATGSGGSTGSGMVDDRLFPAEVGRIWTYDVQSTYPSCPSGQRTSEILETVTVDGKSAYRTTGICGFETAITVTGDVVESKYESYPWFRMLDEPVQDGHSWTTTNGAANFDMHYESAGSVTTPAGTFDDCWRVVQDVSYQQDWTYCRGVGPVSSTLVDLSGGTIIYELTAKNF